MAVTENGAGVREALDAGLTLPATWYGRDQSVYDRELETIFARAWQYAARADQVAEPSSYVATRVGHIPVVLVRDDEGELRGFVNVCRHRGHLVAQGEGQRQSLQCPYHAWTYGLDGCLRAAPRSEREPGFDFDRYSLLPVSVGTFGPFVFANPDPEAPPLEDALGRLPEHLAASGIDFGRLRFHRRDQWSVPVNWKIGIENYLECYHCPVAHPGFSKLIDVDPDAYVLQAHGLLASQFGPVRRNGGGTLPYEPVGEIKASQFHHLWPNLTINVPPGPMSMSVDTWIPAGQHEIRGTTDRYFAEDVPERVTQEMMAFSTQVASEDRALVESVQQGLDSGMVPHGRLLPESEQLLQHFQRLVYDAVAGP
ncbi:MAG: aromatic ring-hydroxylating dioxygenase subunit alpha [Actinomycetota bacterium]|nr:aromatic ring-hydroxylating dioxygenase subunit alpha [Actinomycetota bacterium]